MQPPDPGRAAAESFVAQHLGHLVDDEVTGSSTIRGGQTAADAALAGFDVGGYAARRNEVHPEHRRGASRLSPFIRHGLLPLRIVWDHVAGGPTRDVRKFRDELLWQEYARHWYARLGATTRSGIRREIATVDNPGAGWDRTMACVDLAVTELETDGWLVNQTRMWLASQWAVRDGRPWRDGEDGFFTHLLDGSRAANRLGWQWTTGVGSQKPYGFSRYQVEKRAPGVCATCPHEAACPIADWPDDPHYVEGDRAAPSGGSASVGPDIVDRAGAPTEVWLTAESLGDDDPALAAHPELPAVFVFDEPLLDRLRLSAKRLVFLVETLADLATRRPVDVEVGEPVEVLAGRPVAVTHAPVPGFAVKAARVSPVEVHPWPWLVTPHPRSIASFSAWRRHAAPPP